MMMCSKGIIFITIMLLHVAITAQRYNNWNFGSGESITFNTGNYLLPRILPSNAMESEEGNASISDAQGNILFYTHGRRIYNKLNQIMSNGDLLLGNTSSFQSSIIIPYPGNAAWYYLFTTDAFENGFGNGYRYHNIDMSGDNGNGTVTTKNQLLTTLGTERIAAVQHANGIDVWLITNDFSSNTFRTWLITCNGISATPTIINVGEVLADYPDQNIGALKISPDGKLMCQTHFPIDFTFTGNHFFQLFNFNNATGAINNPKKISLPGKYTYGCEFSPSSTLLYLTDPNKKNILQVDATLPTPAAIIQSLDTIPCDFGLYGIQMAPDLKLYATRVGRYLATVNNPNAKGQACNFKDTSVALTGSAKLNLNTSINNAYFDPYNSFNFTYIDSCTGTLQFNGFSNLQGTVSYLWQFGDGTTSTLTQPIHTYNNLSRQYNVLLTITLLNGCGSINRSRIIAPQGYIVNPNFTFNANCATRAVTFTNTTLTNLDLTNYEWNFGDGSTSTIANPIHIYATPGAYTVTLKVPNANACLTKTHQSKIDIDSINITLQDSAIINEGEAYTINTISNATNYQWTPNTNIDNPTKPNPRVQPLVTTLYKLQASNNANCNATDSIIIKVNPIKEVYIPTAITPNGDGVNDVLQPTFSRRLSHISFTIYNRWGAKVYEGTNANNYTWNAKYKGQPVATGTYIWYFKAVNDTGVTVSKKGTLIVLN